MSFSIPDSRFPISVLERYGARVDLTRRPSRSVRRERGRSSVCPSQTQLPLDLPSISSPPATVSLPGGRRPSVTHRRFAANGCARAEKRVRHPSTCRGPSSSCSLVSSRATATRAAQNLRRRLRGSRPGGAGPRTKRASPDGLSNPAGTGGALPHGRKKPQEQMRDGRQAETASAAAGAEGAGTTRTGKPAPAAAATRCSPGSERAGHAGVRDERHGSARLRVGAAAPHPRLSRGGSAGDPRGREAESGTRAWL